MDDDIKAFLLAITVVLGMDTLTDEKKYKIILELSQNEADLTNQRKEKAK